MVSKSIGLIGNGFIGSNLLKDLKGLGHDVNLVNKVNPHEQQYNVVINAGGSSSKLLPEIEPLKDFDLSVRNTLRYLTETKFDTFIHISSCEVYGSDTKETAEIPVNQISRYGLSKYLSECLVRNYCKNWLILRLHAPVGPNMRKGVIFDALYGDKLWISSKSKSQFLSTIFIAKFINECFEKNTNNEIFNLTGSTVIGIERMMEILGRKVPSPENPVIDKYISVEKANGILQVPTSKESINKIKEMR